MRGLASKEDIESYRGSGPWGRGREARKNEKVAEAERVSEQRGSRARKREQRGETDLKKVIESRRWQKTLESKRSWVERGNGGKE